MPRKDEPTRDARGMYRRDIGWKPDGMGGFSQHRFYLGRDRDEALLRSLQLARVWDAVEKRWERLGRAGRPVWDDLTLQLAQTVARGEHTARVSVPAGFESQARNMAAYDGPPASWPGADAEVNSCVAAACVEWLEELRSDFLHVRIELADQPTEAAGRTRLDKDRRRRIEAAARVLEDAGRPTPASGQTLHQALDGYADAIRKTYLAAGGEDRISPHGMTMLTYVGLLKEHHADTPLDCLGLAELEAMLHYWASRPKGKRGRPIAPDTARDMIKRVRHFVRWLHRSPAFAWRKPADWEDVPIRVKLTHEEKARKLNPAQVETYTLDELCVLYEYAGPWERALLLLALNCGFGRGELESLTTQEVHLRKPHGHYDRVGSWIRRLRYKTTVYAEWSLWDPTVRGVDWLLEYRSRTEHQALLLTGRGRPLSEPTAGNNRNNKIPNTWTKLLDRVRKDHPEFRRLSFNKLRKTAGDLVRRFSDGETAAVFLSHGTPCKSDSLLDRYTNKDFRKVFTALDKVGEHLAPMFAAATVPFPATDRRSERPPLSEATVKRIRQLRREGHSVAKVAREVGVSERAVRRYGP